MTTDKKALAIVRPLFVLNVIPGVTITNRVDALNFWISHSKLSVPDLNLVWNAEHRYFDVYLHVCPDGGSDKERAGVLCTISSGLNATAFVGMYRFLVKNSV